MLVIACGIPFWKIYSAEYNEAIFPRANIMLVDECKKLYAFREKVKVVEKKDRVS